MGAEGVGAVTKPIIYHGTPLTPRAALTSVCTGRAMCVSFFRPDDVEVVEAISPDVMFRQRGLLVLASGNAPRSGLAGDRGLAAVLRLARAAHLHAGALGDHAGHSRCAVPAQRQLTRRLAIRAARSSGLAHGWSARAVAPSVRPARSRLPGMDRPEGRITGLPCAHGGGLSGARQSLASASHAARNGGGLRLSLRIGGQHFSGAERVAL